MKHGILAFAILAATGTTALAGDTNPPIETPPITTGGTTLASPSADWTGYYVGLHYATGELEDGLTDPDIDGFGIHGGYLHDLGSFVVGGELNYTSGDFDPGFGDLDTDTTRLKAIAGYDLGRFLPYVTIGAVTADVEFNGSETGFTYGLGGAYQITDSFRIGAEYIVDDFDDDFGFDVEVNTVELRASYNF